LDALEAYKTVYLIGKVAEEIKKEIQEAAVNEADKYPEKTIEKYGVKITKMEGRATYSFKHIQEWVDLENKKKKVEQAAKDALRFAQQGKMVVTDDSEVIETAEV